MLFSSGVYDALFAEADTEGTARLAVGRRTWDRSQPALDVENVFMRP